jgi:hypothetical protein
MQPRIRQPAPPAEPRATSISRTTVNFFLDLALLLVFMALLGTVVILQFVFPPGPNAAGWQLWGWDYSRWSQFQFGLVSVLTLGILVHVMLHWPWVCNVAVRGLRRDRQVKAKLDDGTRTLIGVGVLIVILHVIGLFVAVAWLTITPPSP